MSKTEMKSSDLSDFKCQGCGSCCRQKGYVRLTKNEPENISKFLEMGVYEFNERYTILTKDRQTLSLIEKENGECISLTNRGCQIQAVKPKQYLEFPFKWKFKDFTNICGWAKDRPKN